METGQVGSVSEKYGWHTQPLPLMSLLFLAELVVFFRVYANIQIREEKNDWMVWLIYAVLNDSDILLHGYAEYFRALGGGGSFSRSRVL